MSCSQEGSSHGDHQKRYKGVRRRKWGKWVSEIRIPGTRDRLWLGSYFNQEAAAIAYDTAMFCLRGPSSVSHLNLPMCLPNFLQSDMSPKSIQTVASNAAMAIDFELANRAADQGVDNMAVREGAMEVLETQIFEDTNDIPDMYGGGQLRGEGLNISVDDIEIYLG